MGSDFLPSAVHHDEAVSASLQAAVPLIRIFPHTEVQIGIKKDDRI